MELYTYKAIVSDVYDGDSCTVDIDLGFGIWARGVKLRLANIDTPELRGENREQGKQVRDYVRNLILNKQVVVKNVRYMALNSYIIRHASPLFLLLCQTCPDVTDAVRYQKVCQARL